MTIKFSLSTARSVFILTEMIISEAYNRGDEVAQEAENVVKEYLVRIDTGYDLKSRAEILFLVDEHGHQAVFDEILNYLTETWYL